MKGCSYFIKVKQNPQSSSKDTDLVHFGFVERLDDLEYIACHACDVQLLARAASRTDITGAVAVVVTTGSEIAREITTTKLRRKKKEQK